MYLMINQPRKRKLPTVQKYLKSNLRIELDLRRWGKDFYKDSKKVDNQKVRFLIIN